MEKFKLWVAVDDNGDVFAYVCEKPKYYPIYGEWRNDPFTFSPVGRNKELKTGPEAIKEIEVEFPMKGEEIVQHNEQSGIIEAAKQKSHETYGYEESDYTTPFCHGAEWAKEKCNQIMRRVLEHYERGDTMDCIMADYEEIISIEME